MTTNKYVIVTRVRRNREFQTDILIFIGRRTRDKYYADRKDEMKKSKSYKAIMVLDGKTIQCMKLEECNGTCEHGYGCSAELFRDLPIGQIYSYNSP